MPMYHYRCRVCKGEVDLLLPVNQRDKPGDCPVCNAPLDRDYMGEYNTSTDARIASRGRAWQWNKGDPFVAEHLGPHPMTFNSQRDLAKACESRGVSIGRLE